MQRGRGPIWLLRLWERRSLLGRHGRGLALLTSLLCGLLFLGFAAEGDTPAAHLPLLFFALPAAVCGIAFGLRGGLVAAVASFALIMYGSHLSLLGSLARAVVLVLLGGMVGLFADERRRLVSEIGRQDDLSQDLIGTASFDGFFTRLSPAWTRTLGYSREELLARPFLEFFHPDDREATAAEAARIAESNGESVSFQNRMLHQDGRDRWMEWDVHADTDARSFIVVGRDISARKEAESREEQAARDLALALEDARESNLRLHLVAEAVNHGLVTFDAEGTILRFNSSSERFFGYQREEVIGKNVSVLMPEPDRAQHDGYIANYLRRGEAKTIGIGREVVGKRKDGSTFPMELAIGEVSRRGEKNFIGIVRDITERKQLEAAALHYKDILEQTVRERTGELRERTKELDEARVETLRKLALAAEYRDDQTFEHAERVGKTAALLGELLGLTVLEVDTIRQAAPLHDIGKLAVSDTTLLKPGKLTPEQWQQMRRHTTAGHEILAGSNSNVLSLAAEIALSHHEHWDGNGYPAQLTGEQIPLSGRIVALADVYDSLCHKRPYKQAWTVEHAVAEIHRLNGTQFDPAVVDAFSHLDPYQLAERTPTSLPTLTRKHDSSIQPAVRSQATTRSRS
jgi:PAS domain S-box-containing protein